MDRNETVARLRQIAGSLRSARIDLPDPSADADVAAGLVEKLPTWVARFGPLGDGQNTWIYCEPHRGAAAGALSQIQLRMPAGCYLMDTFDTASHICLARESARGSPLVVGLIYTGRPILLWIRPAR